MKTGVELIAAERQRQIEVEGWTPEHDDEHTDGELARAACCYAAPRLLLMRHDYANVVTFCDPWPWENHWDKRYRYGERRDNPGNVIPNPKTYTLDERLDLLAKAGALIAAEIDRLQRVTATQPAAAGGGE